MEENSATATGVTQLLTQIRPSRRRLTCCCSVGAAPPVRANHAQWRKVVEGGLSGWHSEAEDCSAGETRVAACADC